MRALLNLKNAIFLLFLSILFYGCVQKAPYIGKKAELKESHKVVKPETPILTVSPNVGKPKTPIIVEGKGFKPGEQISLLLKLSEYEIIGLGTRKVEAIVADEEGNFKVETAIPKMAKPGEYLIIAEGDKGSYATTKIKVIK